jgi:hypothetical protein
VNRAELTAILWALRHTERKVIATDSMVAIHQIRGYLIFPRKYTLHPMYPILREVADAILDRLLLGIYTTFVKVPAHSGVRGNEWADWHASAALTGADTTVFPDPVPPRRYWLRDTERRPPTPLGNLAHTLVQKMDATYGLHGGNTGSIYYQAYQQIADDSHPSSHRFVHDPRVTWGKRKQALKYRGGGIITNKTLFQWGLKNSASCPLCGGRDSQSHLLGGCAHDEFRRMTIQRHNDAALLMVREILRGERGGMLTHVEQSDIGNKLGVPQLAGAARSLPWRNQHGADLPRPDFILSSADPTPAHPHRRHSWVFEVKMGQDTRLEDKIQPAVDKVQPLLDAIREHWRHPPSFHVLLLGVGGRMPEHTVRELREAGVTGQRLERLLFALNRLAVDWLHAMVVARRRLEPD